MALFFGRDSRAHIPSRSNVTYDATIQLPRPIEPHQLPETEEIQDEVHTPLVWSDTSQCQLSDNSPVPLCQIDQILEDFDEHSTKKWLALRNASSVSVSVSARRQPTIESFHDKVSSLIYTCWWACSEVGKPFFQSH